MIRFVRQLVILSAALAFMVTSVGWGVAGVLKTTTKTGLHIPTTIIPVLPKLIVPRMPRMSILAAHAAPPIAI